MIDDTHAFRFASISDHVYVFRKDTLVSCIFDFTSQDCSISDSEKAEYRSKNRRGVSQNEKRHTDRTLMQLHVLSMIETLTPGNNLYNSILLNCNTMINLMCLIRIPPLKHIHYIC